MSEKIDNFTNTLRDQLNAMDDRLTSIKSTIESASQETEATVESKLNEVKAKLKTKQNEFATYRTKLANLVTEKESEVMSKVEGWKTKRETEHLNRRAVRAEDHAASGIVVAMAAMDEAEEAVLEAIAARLDADKSASVKATSAKTAAVK